MKLLVFFLMSSILMQTAVLSKEKDLDKGRYERGLENLKRIDGKAGENVINALKDIAPDLAKYTIEYPFGDIYNRKGLSLRDREIATVSMLAAMGNASAQLKVHIHAALNVGVKKEEIIELLIQTSVYAGFPASLNAMFAAKEVFEEVDKEKNEK